MLQNSQTIEHFPKVSNLLASRGFPQLTPKQPAARSQRVIWHVENVVKRLRALLLRDLDKAYKFSNFFSLSLTTFSIDNFLAFYIRVDILLTDKKESFQL
jgi:hypothetical protein